MESKSPLSTPQNYYTIEAVSNSLLGRVKAILSGQELSKAPVEAWEFGSQVHEAILEPEIYKSKVFTESYQKHKYTVHRIAESLKENLLLTNLIKDQGTMTEYEHFWQEPMYGLECKMKADIYNAKKCIANIKTTDAKSMSEFIATCRQYGYFRQAAFYMDALSMDSFVFFAVQKKPSVGTKHRTFTLVFSSQDADIKEGRAEYEWLLGEYLKLKGENKI